jgi:hypothetical protein
MRWDLRAVTDLTYPKAADTRTFTLMTTFERQQGEPAYNKAEGRCTTILNL